MRKIIPVLIFLTLTEYAIFPQEAVHAGPSVDFSKGLLKVSESGRFLQHENGEPFYYFGGTAWELFHRCSREDAEFYLENRRAKGFTVIQAVALAERNGLRTPNAYGDLPLIDEDPGKPNEKYWKHVDWIINKAEEKGLYIGLLPTWGDKVDKRWGAGPVIFNEVNAYAYGKWIGNRYKDQPNIIWINGGDRDCAGENQHIWEALARGIKETDPNHLMTFHPWGGTSSSQCFHEAEWLDFNLLQSGHGDRYIDNYAQVSADYQLSPPKPCLDGEPNYEEHPVRWNKKYGWFTENDVRRACYMSVFAGGIGATYGAHPIWQFHTESTIPVGDVRMTWKEALDLPGAWDIIHLRHLMESRPFHTATPDQSLILSENTGSINKMVAMKGDGFLVFYLPANFTIKFKPYKLKCEKLICWWYNPRTGEVSGITELDGNTEPILEVPVGGVDWVLCVDDASRNYPIPGAEQRK